MADRRWILVAGLAALALAVILALQTGVVPFPGADTHERATVRILEDDRVIATVEARVADTGPERYRGLSDAETLANGSGMLFVHRREATYTYVMREMNFGLDMIFVAANGTVTAVRSAPPPGPGENGNSIQRTGRGKYVLEVPRGYANATGIDRGDRVEIEYGR